MRYVLILVRVGSVCSKRLLPLLPHTVVQERHDGSVLMFSFACSENEVYRKRKVYTGYRRVAVLLTAADNEGRGA